MHNNNNKQQNNVKRQILQLVHKYITNCNVHRLFVITFIDYTCIYNITFESNYSITEFLKSRLFRGPAWLCYKVSIFANISNCLFSYDDVSKLNYSQLSK